MSNKPFGLQCSNGDILVVSEETPKIGEKGVVRIERGFEVREITFDTPTDKVVGKFLYRCVTVE